MRRCYEAWAGMAGPASITPTNWRLSQDLPIILEVIESQERIDQILPRLDEMVEGRIDHAGKSAGDFVPSRAAIGNPSICF